MKKHNKIFMIILTVCLYTVLYSGCETPVSLIVPYSGNWSFTFNYANGTSFANSAITIQDTGSFCGKLTLSGSSSFFYIRGDISGDGKIEGVFANDCSGSSSGKISGTFIELMGAGYASGTFNDTLRNPNYKGTWQARRN